jgi:transposase InsO family protein
MANFLKNMPAPILTGTNYSLWAHKMKTVLLLNEVWDVVESEFITLAATALTALSADALKAYKELQHKDLQARCLIEGCMEESILTRITGAENAHQAWKILETTYKGTDRVKTVRLQNLRRDFENLKMKDSESVDQFLTRVTGITNQFQSYNEALDMKTIVEKVLRSLTKKYAMIVIAIEESKDLTQLTLDELTGSLLSHESRLNQEDEPLANAFSTQASIGRGRGRGGRGRGKRGRGSTHGEDHSAHAHDHTGHADQNFQGQRGRGKKWTDKSNSQCNYCKKYGHYARECRKRLADQNGGRAHVSHTEEGTSESMFLSCHIADEDLSKDRWLLDSGCSNHMTGNKKFFSSIDCSATTEIKLGDHTPVPAEGKGLVPVLTKQNQRKVIEDVFYVPNLKVNLLSVGQLMQNGYDVQFHGSSCVIYDKTPCRRLLARVEMTKNRMFPLCLKSVNLSESYAHTVSSQDETWLWHYRYGHLPFKSLSRMHKQSMVLGLPVIDEHSSSCEDCILGKHQRDSFPHSESRVTGQLDLVHTDICGPMQTPSIGGCFYFLTFIDDFSRKTWVYFLKKKSETFSKFKEFRALVEKQSGKSVKILRSDGGGEYDSNEFTDYCKQHGIARQYTTRYTPQQNGVAERKNRTIMNMARSMLSYKKLSNEYWAEAVACSVYLLNRSPTVSIKNLVPEEAWSGTKIGVAHLRIFGSVAFAHVPEDLRKKLDNRSEKCIFTGYSEQHKAYKLYNPITKKVVVSRDVKFMEDKCWGDSASPSAENQQAVSLDLPAPSLILPRLQVQQQEVLPSDSSSSSSSSRDSTPSPPHQRRRSLREIYEQDPVFDEQAQYAFCSYQPTFFEEAVKEEKWVAAMNEEIDAIERNQTWDLVDLPADKTSIGVKWVYKTKLNEKAEVARHKARLVAKGFAQRHGVDYDETFAPVARMDTIRAVLAIAAQNKWPVYQMDVKSAFLNGFLDKEVYVDQPPGYEVKDQEQKVYKLKKALYGLKQAPRAWYSRIDSYLIANGFSRSENEPTLYVKTDPPGNILLVCIYVDDMIYTGNLMLQEFKTVMQKEFEMTDMGLMRYFLGLEVDQSDQGIFICQHKYAADILKRFRMDKCKAAETPIAAGTKLSKQDTGPAVDSTLYKQMVGSLMYLTATRPDLMYAVSLISRFMESPKDSHWKVGKRILRYVAGTAGYGLWYTRTSDCTLTGYTDSDFAGCIDDRKSTAGYAFHFGSNLISWASKKQPIVSLSSAEAEYVAATTAACHAVWLRRLLKDMGHAVKYTTTIFCDNSSAIALSKNHVFHKKSKHIDTRYHFIRELVKEGEISLLFCGSKEQLADMFTKPLGKLAFEYQRQHLGIGSADDVIPFVIKREC